MANTYSNLLYHIVFSTKHRQPLIEADFRGPLFEYIGGIIRGERGSLLEIGGMPDHVHILASFRTDVSVALMVQKIKGASSRWRNEHRGIAPRFDWQTGYGAFTVSQSVAPKVGAYIRGQEEHHRKVSYKDELIALLQKNRVAFDERYLLD